MQLNPRQLGTMLAALRLYQKSGYTDPALAAWAKPEILSIASDDDSLAPLSDEEVDNLAMDLNFAALIPATAGEWEVERDARGELAIWDQNGNHLLHSESRLSLEEREANAHLMKAAPALKDALDYLLEQTVDMDLNHGITLTEGETEARQQALAAIALTLPG